MILMAPYVIIMAGIIGTFFLFVLASPMSEKYMITAYLPVLVLAMALYLAMAVAVLAYNIYLLRLYLERLALLKEASQ